MTWLSRVASRARDGWLDLRHAGCQDEFAMLYRQIRGRTVCGHARLRALFDAVTQVMDRGIPGDIVECGTARGGSAALMALRLRQRGDRRLVWACDTFEGLPPPTERDPDWRIARRYTGRCRGALEDVTAWFEELGVSHACRFIAGDFRDTLPSCPVRAIALLHIDCDWYDSVRTCLEALYDRVSLRGIIQIDDYGHWEGARKAVDEFMRERGLRAPLTVLDYTGRQMTKPSPAAR